MNGTIVQVLDRLDRLRLRDTLGRSRPDTIMVTVVLVGERIGIDRFEDGHAGFSRLRGDESMDGAL